MSKHARSLLLVVFVAQVTALCSDNLSSSVQSTTCVSSTACAANIAKPMPFPAGGVPAVDETIFIDSGNNVFFDLFLTSRKKRGAGALVLVSSNGSPSIPTTCVQCNCDDADALLACKQATPAATIACPGGYTIPYRSGNESPQFACVQLGGPPLSANQSPQATGLLPAQRNVKITIGANSNSNVYDSGAYATAADGSLLGLALRQGDILGFLFLACGPFIETGLSTRKRASSEFSAAGVGVFNAAGAGDPHLIGADGVKYDFAGQAGGDYVLFSSPVFVINMHLAARGPSIHFITAFGLLYRGAEIKINPFSTTDEHTKQIAAHFEALGGGVKVRREGWRLWITFCDNHAISFVPMHTSGANAINYFDFTVSVPGCHDAYDGALGFTYRCSHHTTPTVWSSDQEEQYRLPSLMSPSGRYVRDAGCAHEDQFGEDRLLGGMFAQQ